MNLAYIFLAVLLFFMYSLTLWESGREGFESEETQTFEDFDSIYDAKYAAIHDVLWNSNELIKYQGVSIQQALALNPDAGTKILDLCCGTAPNACAIVGAGAEYLGIDTSQSMIDVAKSKCSTATFQKGDITQAQLFAPKSFGTCLLLGFSIYQFGNPKVISDNVFQWLKPGGFFVVHLVDPDKYDPLHDLASPFAAFSLQKYSLDRQVESQIFFDQFKYTGKLMKKKDVDTAIYQETFSFYDPKNNGGTKYRENKHRWNMPSKERMIDIFKSSGLKLMESLDLVRCGKEYQYLVFLTK